MSKLEAVLKNINLNDNEYKIIEIIEAEGNLDMMKNALQIILISKKSSDAIMLVLYNKDLVRFFCKSNKKYNQDKCVDVLKYFPQQVCTRVVDIITIDDLRLL